MTGVAGWNGSAFASAKAMYVALGDGTGFKLAKAVYGWNGTAFVRVFPNDTVITTFTAVLGSPTQTKIVLNWNATNAVKYRLWRGDAGTGTKLVDGTALTYTDTVSPGTSNRYTLEAQRPDGAFVAKAVTITSATGLAPTSLHLVSNAYNKQTVAWGSSAGAVGYELVKVSPGSSTTVLGNVTSYGITGTSASTTYSWKVRAKFANGSFSPYSNTLTYTSSAAPGPAKGTYYFKPTGNDTWQSAYSSWRPGSDALYHGNGAVYGSPRGTQTALFYYGNDRFSSLDGGKITKLEVWIQRTNDAVGLVGDSLSHWLLHPHTSRPGGTPSLGSSAVTDAGSLSRGEGTWVSLPLSWAAALIANNVNRGVGWGHVSTSTRYMNASSSLSASSSGHNPNGTLRFTVG